MISYDGVQYRLSPAYDLISVKLSFPQDSEEMAMTFEVCGAKTGFDRKTFSEAFRQSGLNEKVSEKLISKMIDCKPKWEVLIANSFLPDSLKKDLFILIETRLAILETNAE